MVVRPFKFLPTAQILLIAVTLLRVAAASTSGYRNGLCELVAIHYRIIFLIPGLHILSLGVHEVIIYLAHISNLLDPKPLGTFFH